MFVALLGGEAWDSWEGSFEANISSDIIGWQSIEFSLVRLHLLDKVHKVSWLFEELEILSINQVTKLILDLDYKLNGIE